MGVTAFSGGQMTMRGMDVYRRQDNVPEPEAEPETPRFRLTVEKAGTDEKDWPRATSTNRADLLSLLENLEELGYSLVSLERLPTGLKVEDSP